MVVKAKAEISLVRVDDGAAGTPGKPGADGKTPYLHIAYANSADGKTGFSITDSANKSYIGQYTDYISQDSTDPTKYSWTKIKGSDGTNGIGISNLQDQYYQSSSNTQLIGGSWLSAYPPWVDGKYLWSRYVITYTNGTTEQTAPVCMTGPQGITGNNGVGVSDIDALYAKSNSNSTAPTSGWSITPPAWTNGTYIWSKTVIKYTNGKSVETSPVCLTGSTGANGKPGVDGKPGADGENGRMLFGTCSTAAATVAKVATVDGFSLYKGVTISILFTYGNTVSSPTLNVNSTGAKLIRLNGTNYSYWMNNNAITLVYDGTYWQVCSAAIYGATATIGNPLAGNVYLDNDSFDIRNGSTVLASFGSSFINLGMNSDSSIVSMCGGKGKFHTSKLNDIYYQFNIDGDYIGLGGHSAVTLSSVGDPEHAFLTVGSPALGSAKRIIKSYACDKTTGVYTELVQSPSDFFLASGGKSGKLQDWIIDEGNSGIWYYRKWASGKAECYGSRCWTITNRGNYWLGITMLPFTLYKNPHDLNGFFYSIGGGNWRTSTPFYINVGVNTASFDRFDMAMYDISIGDEGYINADVTYCFVARWKP